MNMRIVQCGPELNEAWNRYVHSSPRASFYHRAEWRTVNARSLGLETAHLAAFDGDRIVGVFPIVRLRSRIFGHIACSMPFMNHGGPCGDNDDIEERLLEAGAKLADEWEVDYLEVRSKRYFGDGYPSATHKVSMTIALDPDPDKVMARFQRDHRAEIRRAAKRGFVAKFGHELVDDFYDVLSASWRDRGTPIFRADYLDGILRSMPESTTICVVYDGRGEPAAAAFQGLHNGTVEGLWLGIRSEYRRHLVGYVLYWALIKDACELGAHTFHLGRSSKDSGGEQFKRKWNAEALQLYWTYVLRTRTELPSLNPDNPKFRLAIEAWRCLPVTLTQWIGPYIARSIP